MCGIAGIFHPNAGMVEKRTLKAMCDVIRSRGPDEEGFYVDHHVGLGIRRLKIIDLVTGKQPVHNEDGTIWTVFNGEIYNYRELRDGLIGRGHKFYTNTDTEVIVHLYEEYGENFVSKLMGMFGIALWDTVQRKFMLVRDRLGIKPLCYFQNQEKIVFGSEIKSILVEGTVERSMSISGLDHYMSFGYVPAPSSIFEGIKKLEPGHFLLVQDGKTEIKQYWDVVFNEDHNADEEFCKEKLLKLLDQSVKRRLISDVPLGAFLSGGIDSTTVVGLMTQLMEQPVKTFSIGFHEEEYNELGDAQLAANYFGTDHTELIVNPNAIELLPRLVESYDEPFADSSAIPTFYVTKLASEHVTVALSGDGGDELFGGYNRYIPDSRDQSFGLLPEWVRKTVLGRIGQWLPMSMRGKDYLQYISKSSEQRYLQRVGICSPEIKKTLYCEEMNSQLWTTDAYQFAEEIMKNYSHNGYLNRLLYRDLKTYLPNDILVKVDIASMVHSLEVRVPFLDHELVEFAATIPQSLKIRKGSTKYILKQAIANLVPSNVLNKRKQGFAVPLNRWFRKELKDYSYDLLTSSAFKNRGIFSGQSVEDLLDKHQKGHSNYGAIIWALTFFETWMETYMTNEIYSSSP